MEDNEELIAAKEEVAVMMARARGSGADRRLYPGAGERTDNSDGLVGWP
jgi:hypothetical protein